MSHAVAQHALKHYAQVNVRSGVDFASPHRLIQMLMEGGLSRLAAAARFMRQGELAAKGESIGLAISIIAGLQASLDAERGGEIAANLGRLYDYMTRVLLEANSGNDPAAVEHVHDLLAEIKAGWDAIPTDASAEEGEGIARPPAA